MSDLGNETDPGLWPADEVLYAPFLGSMGVTGAMVFSGGDMCVCLRAHATCSHRCGVRDRTVGQGHLGHMDTISQVRHARTRARRHGRHY